mmetsp:Transcript_15044/g.58956  ORF Transcript_15044/g.58956 Transcript_15044/m.58956 type:complete len:318 (-) Transcript_15044:364-1317(-)
MAVDDVHVVNGAAAGLARMLQQFGELLLGGDGPDRDDARAVAHPHAAADDEHALDTPLVLGREAGEGDREAVTDLLWLSATPRRSPGAVGADGSDGRGDVAALAAKARAHLGADPRGVAAAAQCAVEGESHAHLGRNARLQLLQAVEDLRKRRPQFGLCLPALLYQLHVGWRQAFGNRRPQVVLDDRVLQLERERVVELRERQLPGHQLPKDDAEAVHVHLRRHFSWHSPLDLHDLRRHVQWSANGLCEAVLAVLHEPAEAKVADLDVQLLVVEQVVGLEVEVDHRRVVGVQPAHALRRLPCPVHPRRQRKLPLRLE